MKNHEFGYQSLGETAKPVRAEKKAKNRLELGLRVSVEQKRKSRVEGWTKPTPRKGRGIYNRTRVELAVTDAENLRKAVAMMICEAAAIGVCGNHNA